DALGCGAHLPYDERAAADLIRAGTPPTRLNNNCSGKHTGFLATARHLGEPIKDYLDPEHPVQKRLYEILVEFGGSDLAGTGRGIDGCGIPVYGMGLGALARAAAKMAAPKNMPDARGRAIKRILGAMMAHPYMVAGRGRFDTIAMQALGGRVASKSGAEGVHIAMLIDKGLGIALKVEDGTKRAADTAMAAMFEHLGVLDDKSRKALKDFIRPAIVNAAGDPAGEVRMAAF
ncbi:MAG: asparaginase, partial [Proteobacteria bacterium]|nr:asparaginase [Pseudomonadota bacterium]